jgi:hypothetical protein
VRQPGADFSGPRTRFVDDKHGEHAMVRAICRPARDCHLMMPCARTKAKLRFRTADGPAILEK